MGVPLSIPADGIMPIIHFQLHGVVLAETAPRRRKRQAVTILYLNLIADSDDSFCLASHLIELGFVTLNSADLWLQVH